MTHFFFHLPGPLKDGVYVASSFFWKHVSRVLDAFKLIRSGIGVRGGKKGPSTTGLGEMHSVTYCHDPNDPNDPLHICLSLGSGHISQASWLSMGNVCEYRHNLLYSLFQGFCFQKDH